jgi:hypothetical protein
MTKNRDQLKNLLTMRKFSVSVGLAGLATVHIMDLPGKWSETPYLAFSYIAIIVFSGLLIERILKNANRFDFLATILLALGVLAGFVINRTVGMPGAMDDIGNWFEPLGLLSLFVEIFTAYQALEAYRITKRLVAFA